MNDYQDTDGLWHDRKSKNSQNVFIYGAYAKALGLDTSRYPEYFKRCVVSLTDSNITIKRRHDRSTPPFSYDEFLGALYLNLIPYDIAKGNHFVYFGRGIRLEHRLFERLAKALIEYLIPKVTVRGWRVTVKKPDLDDRNRWWEKNLTNVKHFAVRLTPDKIYAVKKYFRRDTHFEEKKLFEFFRDCTSKTRANSTGEYSTRNLLWLMLIMVGDNKRARKLKPWVSFEKYFGAGHPFTIAIKQKYNI